MRSLRCLVLAGLASVVLAACSSPAPGSSEPAWAPAVEGIVGEMIESDHLAAVIVRVTKGEEVALTGAWGESLPGVPATTSMHFRNGAVAISEVATVLLQLVDEGMVRTEDVVARWLPDLPHADRVTLGQLAQMTSGYPDYVWSEAFVDELQRDPFREWTSDELLGYAVGIPLVYPPGTNWNYSHTNYVILGLALEAITGRSLEQIIQERILDPLDLTRTVASQTALLPFPMLHARDAGRRIFLGIEPGVRFAEESTGWSPSWTLARGAVQTTDIADMATMFRAIGRGDLLTSESHELQVAPTLRGRTSALDDCPSCFEQDARYTYGYGIVLHGDWLMQNPLFHGYSGIAAYLPGADVTVAIAATYTAESFDQDGGVTNAAQALFGALAPILAPGSVP